MMEMRAIGYWLTVTAIGLSAAGCTDDSGVPGGTTTVGGQAGHGGAGGSEPSCFPGGGSGQGGTSGPKPLGDLTGPWQLFIDDHVIAESAHLDRVYHAFERYPENPVMTADKPWEDTYVYVYGRVMPNETGSGYRMWYSALDFHDPDGASRVLYATSPDGLTWEKPSLGIRSWQGSTDNNLFIPRDRPNHIMSVLHTPWDPDPSCAYKFINYDGSYQAWVAGYNAACSNDGVHLTDLPQNPVIDAAEVGVGDVAQFTWDPFRRRYLGYVKVAGDVAGHRRRMVGLVATNDFSSWPTATPQRVLEPDAIDDFWATQAGLDLAENRTHFYGVSVFPYQTMYLGLLWIFRAKDPPGCGHDCEPYSGYIFGTIHVELVSSRDGVEWTRVAGDLSQGRPPLLSLGPAGAWDSMMVFTANHPLLEGDELKLYYGGCNEDHGRVGSDGSAAVGLATLRQDGFASLDAHASAGQVTTKPMVGARGRLRVNYRASSSGSVKVEVLDESGTAITGYREDDCDALVGDEVDAAVTWGSTTELPEYPCNLRFRFTLENAALYSFAAGDQLRLAP